MPIPSSVGHTYRVRAPVSYARGRAVTASIETRLKADLVAPTSGTYTLRDSAGNAIIDAQPVVVTGSKATYPITAGELPATLGYGSYREHWRLTHPGGVVTEGARTAYIVREPLYCPVTQQDLEDEVPGFSTLMSNTDTDDIQGWIDGAWADTLRWLESEGRWPDDVVDAHSLFSYVRHAAFFKAFSAMSIANARYREDADKSERLMHVAQSQVRYRVDEDQDGVADSEERHSASQVIRRARPGVAYVYGSKTPRVM